MSLKEKWTKFKEEHQDQIDEAIGWVCFAGVATASIFLGYQVCKLKTAVDLSNALIVDKDSDIGRALTAMRRMNEDKACAVYTKTITNGLPTSKLGELGECVTNLAGADKTNNVKWTNFIMVGSEE